MESHGTSPNLIEIRLTDQKNHPISIDIISQTPPDYLDSGVSSSSFHGHHLRLNQWPTPDRPGEFSLREYHRGEYHDGSSFFRSASQMDAHVMLFGVPEGGIELDSEVYEAAGLELEYGEFYDPMRPIIAPRDRRLILPLAAGQLLVEFSTLPRFQGTA